MESACPSVSTSFVNISLDDVDDDESSSLLAMCYQCPNCGKLEPMNTRSMATCSRCQTFNCLWKSVPADGVKCEWAWSSKHSNCMGCHKSFNENRSVVSVGSNKHHCRRCGGVFCGRCCCASNEGLIPGYGNQPQLQCNACFDKYVASTTRLEIRHMGTPCTTGMALLASRLLDLFFPEASIKIIERANELVCPNCGNKCRGDKGNQLLCQGCGREFPTPNCSVASGPRWIPHSGGVFNVVLLPKKRGAKEQCLTETGLPCDKEKVRAMLSSVNPEMTPPGDELWKCPHCANMQPIKAQSGIMSYFSMTCEACGKSTLQIPDAMALITRGTEVCALCCREKKDKDRSYTEFRVKRTSFAISVCPQCITHLHGHEPAVCLVVSYSGESIEMKTLAALACEVLDKILSDVPHMVTAVETSMVICPSCGFSQPHTYVGSYCGDCGLYCLQPAPEALKTTGKAMGLAQQAAVPVAAPMFPMASALNAAVNGVGQLLTNFMPLSFQKTDTHLSIEMVSPRTQQSRTLLSGFVSQEKLDVLLDVVRNEARYIREARVCTTGGHQPWCRGTCHGLCRGEYNNNNPTTPSPQKPPPEPPTARKPSPSPSPSRSPSSSSAASSHAPPPAPPPLSQPRTPLQSRSRSVVFRDPIDPMRSVCLECACRTHGASPGRVSLCYNQTVPTYLLTEVELDGDEDGLMLECTDLGGTPRIVRVPANPVVIQSIRDLLISCNVTNNIPDQSEAL